MIGKTPAAWAVAGLVATAAFTFGHSHSRAKTRPTRAAHPKTKIKRGPRGKHRQKVTAPQSVVTAPHGSVNTVGEMTSYLKTQGLRPVTAAGIVGNLEQESTLNPNAPGYGLAQWNPSRWASVSAWIRAHGQDPHTAGGQLMYIAANVKSNVGAGTFYHGLRSDLQRARSPQQAALVWMNDYEQCDGAGSPGTVQYTQGSLCMPEQRQRYAVRAAIAQGPVRRHRTALLHRTVPGQRTAPQGIRRSSPVVSGPRLF